jgi:hypothetical protein
MIMIMMMMMMMIIIIIIIIIIIKTSDIGTMNSNERIVETLYSLGTCFVSGIYVQIPCIKEIMIMIMIMMMMMMMMMMIIIIIIVVFWQASGCCFDP